MSDQCSLLSSRTSFADYIALLRNVTSQDLNVQSMEPCRSEICSVLYGTGNADISGIGVIVGYFLELSLGVLLAITRICLDEGNGKRSLPNSFHASFATYADAAILLTFSIQLASMIILIRKDYGISADSLGGLTVEVTWAAALVTMLPMLLVCSIGAELKRKDLRLAMALVAWVLFSYTFISRMVANFGPSQIAPQQPGAPPPVITPEEFANIHQLCWSGPSGLSPTENIAFNVFTIGGSIFVSLGLFLTIGAILVSRRRPELVLRWQIKDRFTTSTKRKAKLLIAFNVLLWGVPQLWAILVFRSLQQRLATVIGTADQDNSWSFGQIVAVVVFLPVFLEFIYVFFNGLD